MANSDAGETLTASLIEEVFDAVELLKKSEKHVSPPKASSSFLAKEFNADLNLLFNKKSAEKKTLKQPEPENKKNEVECSLIQEDDFNDSEDPNPFSEGEGTKWITSTTVLSSRQSQPANYFSDGIPKNGNKWTNVKATQDKLNSKIKELESDCQKSTLFDPVLNMRIINPKVSCTLLKERMIDREAAPPIKIKKFLETTNLKEVNWVTGGAIIGKFLTKSQKGNPYCIWNLTDLKGDIKSISVFLFGSAYKEFWKLSLGTVVGILNPSQLDNKNSKVEATLRVDRADSIMIFGMSKDYGTCRSKKSNGEMCTAVVNKSACEYCIYHVKQVYEKASRRSELQASFTGHGLVDLRNKVLGKNEVFYGGKSFTAIKGKPSSSKCGRDQAKTGITAVSNLTKIRKDKELLQKLNGEVKTVKPANEEKKEDERSSKLTTVNLNGVGDDSVNKPKMIDLDMPITNTQIMRARANAIRFIRKNGPLKKPNDCEKSKRTPEQIKSLKRKLEAEEDERKRMKTGEDRENIHKTELKKKLEKSGITDKFLELMNAPIENLELLKEAEKEESEKYFTKLEFREKLEEKMANTYKIDCKAVRCLKCNYKSFSASDLCKKEKHPLKVVSAVKRFWKCGDCSARTVCLELVPLHACKTCGSSKWERTSMLSEKKSLVLPNEKLSIRGHEEKFLGSSVQNANINLLVPDEGS